MDHRSMLASSCLGHRWSRFGRNCKVSNESIGQTPSQAHPRVFKAMQRDLSLPYFLWNSPMWDIQTQRGRSYTSWAVFIRLLGNAGSCYLCDRQRHRIVKIRQDNLRATIILQHSWHTASTCSEKPQSITSPSHQKTDELEIHLLLRHFQAKFWQRGLSF